MGEKVSRIYIISARGQTLKVGISHDPLRRLQALQSGSPFMLWPEYTFEVDDAAAWEKRIHRLLAEYRSHGEWFKLPVSRALEIIREALKGQAKIRQYSYSTRKDRFEEGESFVA